LDLGGLIPGIGEPLDLVNAGIYLLRKDYLNAGLSASSVIPLVGVAGTVGKYINKGAKAVDRIDDVYDAAKAVKKADDIYDAARGATNNNPVITRGKAQAPKSGIPNSVYEKLDNQNPNTVVSRTIYDSNGNVISREDYYTGSNPHTHYDKATGQNFENHKHIYKYNDKGQRIGEEVIPLN